METSHNDPNGACSLFLRRCEHWRGEEETITRTADRDIRDSLLFVTGNSGVEYVVDLGLSFVFIPPFKADKNA
jgi:hypothetical protein